MAVIIIDKISGLDKKMEDIEVTFCKKKEFNNFK